MVFSKESKIITGIYAVTVLLWIWLTAVTKHTPVLEGFYFHVVFKLFITGINITAVLGGIFGLLKVNSWGGTKTVMGKAMLGLSLGIISWGIGSFYWEWAVFQQNIEIPYPSFGDYFFSGIYLFSMYGVFELSKAIGIKYKLKTLYGKLLFLVVPAIQLLISYYLIVILANGGSIELSEAGMQLFFDIYYPLGSALLFSSVGVVYVLSKGYLGGRFKPAIFWLFWGFVFNYLADVVFSYTTNIGTYFNGHFADLLFATAMFVLAVGINNLDPKMKS